MEITNEEKYAAIKRSFPLLWKNSKPGATIWREEVEATARAEIFHLTRYYLVAPPTTQAHIMKP